jgi:acyl transferase domain-containing protein/D-arabinose 1-dehydrogenase-like Zn-dependent alcohol dehydrogenase/NAD(P)-dependent dehydrogenase (short-subunit alcohol dehydrogenase family)
VQDHSLTYPAPPKLIVLSANDKATLSTQAKNYGTFLHDTHLLADDDLLNDLAYTLNERRRAFAWRSAAVVHSPNDLKMLESLLSKPQRYTEEADLCCVFTGQGAQYPGQDLRCLEQFKVVQHVLDEAESYLAELGCQWGVRDELYKPVDLSRISEAEFSQPLSTIVQIALIDLFRSFGVYPSSVVGHSSGEMAAAYCTGALSARSAIKVAYFRGQHSSTLAASGAYKGAMMAASLSVQEAQSCIDDLASHTGGPKLTIACLNSPKSVTISGDSAQLDLLGEVMSLKGVFNRKLNVNMAYHSPAMHAVAQAYHASLGKLEKGSPLPHPVTMVSTVTGKWVGGDVLRNPQYWVDNMISPVLFSPVVEGFTFQTNRKVWKRLDCSHRNHPRVTFMLELGFHGAMRGPLRDILSKAPDGTKVKYETALIRNHSPMKTLFASLGELFNHGCHVDLGSVNAPREKAPRAPKLLCDLPQYQFNHSKSYWEESRISKNYRLLPQKKLDLLGKPSPDWNKAEAKWRNNIRTSEMPWVEDHKISGSVIYPGAGMIVMAIEAANQLADKGREIEGFELRDIRFLSTLSVPRTSNGIETHLYLREIRDASSSETPWSDFRLFCYENEDWTENCRGFIRVQYKPVLEGSDSGAMEFEKIEEVAQCLARESLIQDPEGHEFHYTELYDFIRESGFDYGASFQLLHNGVFKSKDGRADIQLYQWPEDAFPQSHIVHPCSLDAILHLTVAALAEGGRTAIPTAVPSAMKRLWISKHGLSSADATSVRATGWLTEQDTRGTEYNLSVLDATGSKVLLQGEGLRLTIVSSKDFSKTAQSDENQICYHLDWQLAPDSAVKANGVSNGVNGLNGINGRSNGTQIVTNGCHSQPRFVVVANLNLDPQRDLGQRLESVVTEDYFIMSLKEAAQLENKTETSFIFLEELNGPKLMYLSEIDYAALQNILTACKASLWVTNGGGKASQHPSTGVSNGLFRVLRNERPDRPYGILGLDIRCPITESQVTLIHKTFQKIAHLEDPSISDQEYLEIEGKLHVPRVTEAKDITETVYQGSLARRSAIKPLSSCPPVQLTIESTGFLDTLRFTEDDIYDQPLAQGEVEVKVGAVGLNFRDLLAALGRIPSNAFGSEAAGIVTRVGSDSLGFAPGDRVVMATASTFRTFVRAEAFRVLKIDDSMSFTEAATLPTQFCTAYISLYELARLQPDETVLIHTGAGGTGQAAIQVAQYIGATVYVTVGSEAKKRLVMEEYGIPESHVFYSRNTSFAKGIKRVTNGRGVDVILNSLSGDALISSWECIAPYGRFVEIGKKDVLGNTSLPMGMFRQNVQFLCFDGFTMQTERPVQFEKLFQRVLALFRKGALRPVKPLNVFPVSKVEDAFRAMQDGKSAGKFVLEFADDMEVKTTLQTRPSFVVDDSSTYVIAGGLGGLGRNVARWLVDRGAKHMLLLSRSGAQKEAAQEFLAELEGKGVVARAPPCDVTDLDALKNVIEECARDMPPIRGCVQGSMVLRDATFDKMSYADWRVGTDCKTVGSWNLHEVLPNELDFFIMLSSASGVVGLHGQANYAAGNAYMDALARYRVSRGLRATSLDLGALTEDGLLAENKDFLNRVLSYGALNGISRTYFNAIMDYYCNPSLPKQAPMQSQPIIGLGTGDDGIIISRQPIFKHLVTTKKATEASVPGERPQDWKSIFAHNSNEDIAHLVTQALIRKLAKTNSSLQGEVDVFKPLVAYGVDSLLAVELRSWLVKEFGADVALFEIQGGVGFEGLGRIVANRSSVGKKMGGS